MRTFASVHHFFFTVLATSLSAILASCNTTQAPAYQIRPAVTHWRPYQTGIASWYRDHRTASGERFSSFKKTAAHRTLPFGTWVRVTSLRTGRSVVARVNDRGPYVRGRVIDLSHSAAKEIGLTSSGIAKVRIDIAN